MKQILYGVGQSVLKDYVNIKSIIALSKLKDVSVNFSSNEEAVTGGDSPYPIAYFPKDKEITITATNATFDLKMVNATQGAEIKTGQINFTEIIEVDIPADGIIALDHSPLSDSVIIDGYTEVFDEIEVTGKTFFVDTESQQIMFDESESGKEITGVYERQSTVNAETITITQETLAKPFTFIHRIPVYDDNNNIVAQGQLTIYKAKASNNFEFGLQPQTAFAPKLELKALNPKRQDGKLWDFTIDPVK